MRKRQASVRLLKPATAEDGLPFLGMGTMKRSGPVSGNLTDALSPMLLHY